MTPEQLRDLRSRLGLSQAHMAERVGVSLRKYHAWEAGAPIAKVADLQRLTELLRAAYYNPAA